MKRIILFFSSIFLLTSCQKEDTPLQEEGISLQEAQLLVNAQSKGQNQFQQPFTVQWETFMQQGLNKEQRPFASVKIVFEKYPELNSIFVITKTEEKLEGKIGFEWTKSYPLEKEISSKEHLNRSYTARYGGDGWIEDAIQQIYNDALVNKIKLCVVCKGSVYDFSNVEQIRRRLQRLPIAGTVFYPNLCDNCTFFTLKIVPLKEVILTGNRETKYATISSNEFQKAIDLFRNKEAFDGAVDYRGSFIAGGNGAATPEYITYRKNVPPCLKNIINNIGNINSKGQPIPYIGSTNSLGAYIKNLLENYPDIQIDFVVLNLGYGYQNGKTGTFEKGKRYGIAISHDLLERGSELFIAKTVIHEMLHAYFKIQLDKDGIEQGMDDFVSDFDKITHIFNEKFKKDAEHEMMSKMYVELLAESLAAYDDNKHELSYYRSLAWAGLEQTDEYKNLSEEEKTQIRKIAEYERESNPNYLCN